MDNTGYNNRNTRERYGGCGNLRENFAASNNITVGNYTIVNDMPTKNYLFSGGRVTSASLPVCSSETITATFDPNYTKEVLDKNQFYIPEIRLNGNPVDNVKTFTNIDSSNGKPTGIKYEIRSCTPTTPPTTTAKPTTPPTTAKPTLKVCDIFKDGTYYTDPDTGQICNVNDKQLWGPIDNSWWGSSYCKITPSTDKHLCDGMKIYVGRDQDGQTIKKYDSVNDVDECLAKIVLHTDGKGIVYYKNTSECWVIKDNPSPYKNKNSVLIMSNPDIKGNAARVPPPSGS